MDEWYNPIGVKRIADAILDRHIQYAHWPNINEVFIV
jgi:hypothetical protein